MLNTILDFLELSAVIGAAPSSVVATSSITEPSIRTDGKELEYIMVPEPPRHFSRVQLRGSNLPPWFPGIIFYFKIVKSIFYNTVWYTRRLSKAAVKTICKNTKSNILKVDSKTSTTCSGSRWLIAYLEWNKYFYTARGSRARKVANRVVKVFDFDVSPETTSISIFRGRSQTLPSEAQLKLFQSCSRHA